MTHKPQLHAPQLKVPATYMRGGTSNGVFFRLEDLPADAQVPGAARDALLMSLVPRKAYGRASGLERAGDNAGALLGPLLAAALVASFGLRNVMLIAAVPGLLAVVAALVVALGVVLISQLGGDERTSAG